MASTTYTWIHDLNRTDINPITLVAAANQGEQYQNMVLNQKRFLIGTAPSNPTGVWAVYASSDGTSSGAADYWSVPGNVVYDIAGNAHSWIVFVHTNLRGGGSTFLTFDCTNAAGDANPTDVAVYLANVAPTGGSTTARPTSTSETAVFTWRAVYNTTTFSPSRSHAWRNSKGEFVLVSSEDGTGNPDSVLAVIAPQNGTNTNYNALIYNFAAASAGGGTGGWWTTSYWRGFSPAGTTTVVQPTSPARAWTGWTNGVDEFGNKYHTYCDISSTSATTGGYYGAVVDIRATAVNLPSNNDFLPDSDPIIRKSVGALVLPTPTGTGLTL